MIFLWCFWVQFRRRTRIWCVVPPRPWRRYTGNGVTLKHVESWWNIRRSVVSCDICDTVYCVVLLCHTKTKNSDGQIESLLYSVMFWWFCHILSLHAIVLVGLISATGLHRAWGCGSPGQIAVGQQRAWRQQRRGHGTYGTIWHQQKLTKGSLSQGLVMVSDGRWFSCPKSCRCWCYSWWVRCPADGKPGATITSSLDILIPTAVCQTKDVSSPIIPAISSNHNIISFINIIPVGLCHIYVIFMSYSDWFHLHHVLRSFIRLDPGSKLSARRMSYGLQVMIDVQQSIWEYQDWL